MTATPSSPVQQFNLRWNNHPTNFITVFLEQFTAQNLVDVTIACQGQFLKAHKMVLSACSPYFQDLFQVHTSPNPVVIMNHMKFKDIKLIVEFMYRGEIKVLEEDIHELLEVAETLQVKGLSHVRNKYEKGDIQSTDGSGSSKTRDSLNIKDIGKPRKKRKLSHSVNDVSSDRGDSTSVSVKHETAEIKLEVQDDESSENGLKSQADKRRRSSNKSSKYDSKNGKSGVCDDKNNKIPRPPNAFMIFANEWRRRLANENPKDSNKDISVRLGQLWKNLDADSKQSYYKAAKEADVEHKRKYPGYYYSPKEARLRKTQRDQLNLQKLKIKELSKEEHMKIAKSADYDDYLSGELDDVPEPDDLDGSVGHGDGDDSCRSDLQLSEDSDTQNSDDDLLD